MPDAEPPAAQPELPSAYTGGKRRGRTRRTHTVAKVLLATVLTLGMVSGLSVAFLYRHLNGNLDVENHDPQLGDDRPTKVAVAGPREPLNILVMGDDTREGAGNGLDSESGGGSDTTILFHVSADQQSAYGVSIPRDSLVDRPTCFAKDGEEIPGETDAMWNAAYSVGGAACTQRQLEQVTGIRVDNYVVVDFNGFKGMVDAVGGVEVCVPRDLDSDKGDIHIPAGTHTLDGDESLDYIRIRYGVGDGTDLGRIRRQQGFLASLAGKVMSSDMLARPDKLVRFLDAATKSLTTDFESIKELAEIGLQLKDIGPSRIRFITVPWEYSTRRPGRVEWLPAAQTLWDRIRLDEPLGSLRDGSIGVGDVPSSPSTESPSAPSEPSSPAPSVGADAADLENAGLCT